jgi:hypothetical protein
MKHSKDVTDLAATLMAAASAPLVPPATTKPDKKSAEDGGTMQMTLRPSRNLYALYVNKAAERSKQDGRSVSVQEVMLEVLAEGAKA